MQSHASRRGVVSWALALAAALAAVSARADAPSGAYTFSFGGAQSIWVLDEVGECESGDACPDVPVVCDPRGRCSGSGSFLGLDGAVEARLRGSDRTGITRVLLAFRFAGILPQSPVPDVFVRVTGTIKGQIDASGASHSTFKAKACVRGAGCEKVVQTGSFDVTPGEGDWTLDLDVVNLDGTELAGTALASLGGGTEYAYTIEGRFDAEKDQSRLVLLPDAESAGSSVRLKKVHAASGQMDAEIQYTILGHTGKTLASSVQPLVGVPRRTLTALTP